MTVGEEGDFVAVLQRLVEAAQFLIARAHQVLLAEGTLPGPAALHQELAQGAEGRQPGVPVQLLAVDAEGFAVTGEILHADHACPSSSLR